MKDTNFYDAQSSVYSKKRYPATSTEYLHFFFKRRLGILLSYLDFISENRTNMSLLEVGCADGVVLRAVSAHSRAFSSLFGVDISPKMIESAKAEISESNVSFSLRNGAKNSSYDVILEVGVLNLNDLESEISFVKKHLKIGGYYICSLASGTSSRAVLKSKGGDDTFTHFLSFGEYDTELKKHFMVVKSDYYGLFIPLIWKIPFLARMIQHTAEILFKPFVPSLFHEKIYLLRAK